MIVRIECTVWCNINLGTNSYGPQVGVHMATKLDPCSGTDAHSAAISGFNSRVSQYRNTVTKLYFPSFLCLVNDNSIADKNVSTPQKIRLINGCTRCDISFWIHDGQFVTCFMWRSEPSGKASGDSTETP
jgi:hypothetical protein